MHQQSDVDGDRMYDQAVTRVTILLVLQTLLQQIMKLQSACIDRTIGYYIMVTHGQVSAWVPHGRGASSGYISKITAPIEFTAWIREQVQAKLRTHWSIHLYISMYTYSHLFTVYVYTLAYVYIMLSLSSLLSSLSSFDLCICLFSCLCIYLFLSLSIHSSIDLPIDLSIHVFVCLSIYIYKYIYIYNHMAR